MQAELPGVFGNEFRRRLPIGGLSAVRTAASTPRSPSRALQQLGSACGASGWRGLLRGLASACSRFWRDRRHLLALTSRIVARGESVCPLRAKSRSRHWAVNAVLVDERGALPPVTGMDSQRTPYYIPVLGIRRKDGLKLARIELGGTQLASERPSSMGRAGL
jgi:hypothetical protein